MENAPNEVIPLVSEEAASALDIPVQELPPLSDVIDPDALRKLISPSVDLHPPGVTVIFRYAGLDVVVHSGEIICVRPATTDMDKSPFKVE